jgi:hypothetical protein
MRKYGILGGVVIVFVLALFLPLMAQEETKIPVTNVKPLKGTWVNIGTVVIDGVEYPNALRPNGSGGDVEYVISRKYRFFVAEVGEPDNDESYLPGFVVNTENKTLINDALRLGEPPKRIRLPIDEFVRLRIFSSNGVVWMNPYFIR